MNGFGVYRPSAATVRFDYFSNAVAGYFRAPGNPGVGQNRSIQGRLSGMLKIRFYAHANTANTSKRNMARIPQTTARVALLVICSLLLVD